ncbi:DUF1102 domain-containing protein [Halobacterium salinarum]|uniref:DUF1102 domain-containing protein n=1 Tax=Halobacterium salinarum TaxID=2242 RepID=UPI002556D80D|nr:DUF1102 domain-containing protein [Halobacterium salinarum]MDL0125258.1 DUF1102 domain-containing protein [Halobacterium salinarum]MDL0140893.1 DUF1102 domain-containing protein [Halobacterium salinarum]
MQRRKFIAGVGSLAAAGAAGIGTGAFTSVTATRDIDVEVADDASAYLRLEGTGGSNSDYVTDDGDGGTLAISLDSDNSTSGGGNGVNPDALTEIDDLFTIENQGTQEVDVSISKGGDNVSLVSFYPEDEAYDGDSLSSSDLTLGTGDSSDVWVEVDTRGSNLEDEDEILDTVTFTAEA